MPGPIKTHELEFRLPIKNYIDKSRHYHDLEHIGYMFRMAKELDFEITNSLFYAIWYHDAVYDVLKTDNEERSCSLFIKNIPHLDLNGDKMPIDEADMVHAMILATKTHTPVSDFSAFSWKNSRISRLLTESAILIDLDLASLAKPYEEFERDTALIRLEYNHVPESDWTEGRAKWIKSMLDKENIFHTAPGKVLMEKPARNNLKQMLYDLKGI